MHVLALDLGGTKLAAAIFSSDGEIFSDEQYPLDGRYGNAVGELITETIRDFRSRFTVSSIGLSVPGIYNNSKGTVWAPNINGWEEFPLREIVVHKNPDIPVQIDSDRSCYILGEAWKGYAAGATDAIFIAVGTGIGAGILVDGRVLRGKSGIAGAIGWMAVERPYYSRFDARGCFESQASGHGIAELAMIIRKKYPDYKGILNREQALQAKEILYAYEKNDPVAIETINYCIELWGMVCANLISLFNPEMIVFGGGVFGPAVKFMDRIISETEKWAQPLSFKQARIGSSLLGPKAGLYGAAFIALNSFKNNPSGIQPANL